MQEDHGLGWSRMIVQQLPQMPPPSINYIDSSHYWVSRKRRTRSNGKSSCSWSCNKRCRSRRSTEIGQHILEDKHLGEEQKYNNIGFGRPWSGWAGTNVVERFVGLRFRLSSNRYNYVRIESGGHHQISWHWGVANWNDRNIWGNDFAPTGPSAWYEIRIMGDVTAVNVEGGVNVELLDFYNPGRGTPVYLKLNRKYCTSMEPSTII